MRWFKHYSNAHQSDVVTQIYSQFGFQGLGRYWHLLEIMSKKFENDDDTEFTFSIKDLKKELDFHRDLDLFKWLSSLGQMTVKWRSNDAQVPFMSHTSKNQTIIISTRILLELQSRDFKKARSDSGQTAPKNKTKEKEKEKDITTPEVEDSTAVAEKIETKQLVQKFKNEFLNPQNEQDLYNQIPSATIDRWMAIYNNDVAFIQRETVKAFSWYAINSKRAPKSLRGWIQALSSWYERSWKNHIKTIDSKSPGSSLVDDWIEKMKSEESA